MSKKIRAFKLMGGEEVIGTVVEETDTYVVLEKALGLLAQPGTSGVTIALVPYMMSNQKAESFRFERTAIVCTTELAKELEDGYIAQTSTIDLTTKLK